MASLRKKKILLAANNSAINHAISKAIFDSGADLLVIGDLNIEDLPPEISFYHIDLGNVDGLAEQLKPVLTDNGPFDGFVFAAGKGGVRPLRLTKPDFMHDMMRANLYSFVELSRLMATKGVMNEGSSIVVLSSVSSIKGLKSKIAYSASKAALDGAVRSMAAELADKRIRVNSIQKGWVSTDMDLGFIQDSRALADNDDFNKQLLGAVEPEEIAAMVVFLLSDASKSITGTSVLLDGGYTL